MSEVEIRVVGADEQADRFGRVAAGLPAGLKKSMTRAVLYAQGQIPAYPSRPSGSRYRRTGSLGRTVTAFPGVSAGRDLGGDGGTGEAGTPLSRVEVLGSEVKGVVGGRLSYLPYVVDEGGQARTHRGRWWTLQQVIRDARSGIVTVIRDGVLELFK